MADQSKFKLGRKAVKTDSRTLMLADYLTPCLPPPPPTADWTRGITSWGMMLNDTLGCCLVEGSVTHAPDAILGYKSPYSGPVLTFVTASGKRLTVTPNHPMLTPNGFVPAHTLKQFDNLVSTRGSQILPPTCTTGSNTDVDQTPSPIEEIVSSLRLGGGTVREIMPVPVHFHGDGQFINGNIEVVGPRRFLGSESKTTLSQPYTENKVGSAGKLKGYFKSLRASFLRPQIGGSPLFGNMSTGYQRLAFGLAHPGIAQPCGLTQSSYGSARETKSAFHASSSDSKLLAEGFHILPIRISPESFAKVNLRNVMKADRLGTGPEFEPGPFQSPGNGLPASSRDFRDFFGRFSSLVQLDRIVDVEEHPFSGHVYNLSTKSGWYVSNGIVTHNCTIAGCAHAIQVWTANAGSIVTLPDATVEKFYEKWDGYKPGNPSTDNGGVELDVLNDWKKQGFASHALTAFADPRPANLTEVRQSIALFGGVYIGLSLPVTAQNQDVWDVVPNAGSDADPGSWGGHCVYVPKYDQNGFTCITWGQPKTMTVAFWNKYCDEAHVLLSQDWLAAKGSPGGFDQAQLLADLGAIR